MVRRSPRRWSLGHGGYLRYLPLGNEALPVTLYAGRWSFARSSSKIYILVQVEKRVNVDRTCTT